MIALRCMLSPSILQPLTRVVVLRRQAPPPTPTDVSAETSPSASPTLTPRHVCPSQGVQKPGTAGHVDVSSAHGPKHPFVRVRNVDSVIPSSVQTATPSRLDARIVSRRSRSRRTGSPGLPHGFCLV